MFTTLESVKSLTTLANNNNEEYFRRLPYLQISQSPLHHVISNKVQGTHQIDLVSTEPFATTVNNQVYTRVVSILDIFLRYLWFW